MPLIYKNILFRTTLHHFNRIHNTFRTLTLFCTFVCFFCTLAFLHSCTLAFTLLNKCLHKKTQLQTIRSCHRRRRAHRSCLCCAGRLRRSCLHRSGSHHQSWLCGSRFDSGALRPGSIAWHRLCRTSCELSRSSLQLPSASYSV